MDDDRVPFKSGVTFSLSSADRLVAADITKALEMEPAYSRDSAASDGLPGGVWFVSVYDGEDDDPAPLLGQLLDWLEPRDDALSRLVADQQLRVAFSCKIATGHDGLEGGGVLFAPRPRRSDRERPCKPLRRVVPLVHRLSLPLHTERATVAAPGDR